MIVRRFWLAPFIVVAASGCGSEPPSVLVPATLSKVATSDGQSGPAGFRLAQPLIASVLTADGSVATRGAVRWSYSAGTGGSLSDTVTYANGAGQAQVYATLGATPGAYTIRAALVADPNTFVEFSATATAPPAVTSVTPSTFTGGDTLTVQGTGLSGGRVEVSGVPARVLTQSTTTLTAVAPVCLVPGVVGVRARVGTGVTNSVGATYTQSGAPVRLSVGDYASIDPSQLAGCASFPAADANGAEYLLAPQGVTGTPGVATAYRLTSDSDTVIVAPPRVAASAVPWAQQFHDFLRNREAEIARLPKPPLAAAPAGAAATTTTVKVGDRRTFRVCNKIGCQATADFSQIGAEAKFVGAHAAIYQDLSAPAGGFVQSDFDSLGAKFEDQLYDVDTRAFGAESDVDKNGVVIILLTPVVNGLTPRDQCSTSIITGFFFGVDIDPSYATDERSNKGEVFYAVAPDPNGAASCAFSTDLVRRLVPTTFVHEFQHMISYNQHVLLRQGDQEVLWLNEAMSHFAEELGGRRLKSIGDETGFSDFTIGDLYDAYLFLKTPGSFFALPGSGTATLEERGGSWLFLRWLVDQFGDDLTRRLEETNLTGATNIAAATGEPVSTLLPQWFLANYVSDLPGFTAPSRLTFNSWQFRTTYESLNQQRPSRFDRPFPIVPTVFTGGTFAVSGTVRSGSGDYLRVVQAASQAGFTVRMTDPNGNAIDESALPRLNIIRIK